MITAWTALVLVDAVTVASFARCFAGPGELAVLVPVCIGAHLLAHLGRLLRRRGHSAGGLALFAFTVLAVAYVPLVLVDGGSFRFGRLSLTAGAHVLGLQLHAAWRIFSSQVAPVSQAPGLVVAAAWAAGALALAAEALDADTTLPAIVALVPAFDVVVFTGTLGTSTGRAPELAALAALAVWYLGTKRRPGREQVVTAQVEGSGRRAAAEARGGRVRLSGRRRPPALAGLALVAGVSAGLIGPLMPGATSSSLLAWHASGTGLPTNTRGYLGGGTRPVVISSLVDVEKEEIENTNVPLFRVYGTSPTREILFVDDVFTGTQWRELSSSEHSPLRPFPVSLAGLEAHLPEPVLDKGDERVTQVISNIDLGGAALPVPGRPIAIEGDAPTTLDGADGPVVVSSGALASTYTYAVEAERTPSPQVAQHYSAVAPSGPRVDLQLPQPVPEGIRLQAESLVTNSMDEAAKATAIEDFLSMHFTYSLPKTVPPVQASGYAALADFLFRTKTGYCQQFASAFAVLARIDGLPTRIVVGFLPTQERHGSWVVTGLQTHAWPEVYFPGSGWVDFEPTPGVDSPTLPPVTQPGAAATGKTKPSVTGTPRRAGNPRFVTASRVPAPRLRRSRRPARSGDVSAVLLALLAGALLWGFVIPLWRLIRDRRARDPVRDVLLCWREATRVLAAVGLHRRRAETAHEFAGRVRLSGVLSAEAAEALSRLAGVTSRALFAPQPPTPVEVRGAAADSLLVRRAARRSINWWMRIRLQLDPRDLLAS